MLNDLIYFDMYNPAIVPNVNIYYFISIFSTGKDGIPVETLVETRSINLQHYGKSTSLLNGGYFYSKFHGSSIKITIKPDINYKILRDYGSLSIDIANNGQESVIPVEQLNFETLNSCPESVY